MTPTTRTRRERVARGCVAGAAAAELLLLAASIASLGRPSVPLPTWIALVALGALLGGLVTVAAALAASHGGTTINTAYIERLNATLRERLAPLVRRRRAPAHGPALVESGLSLLRLAYNWCWAHASLRLHAIGTPHRWVERTPAMAAGLAARPCGLDELLRTPAPPVPLTAPAAPRRGRPSARGRVLPFPSSASAPPERSAA